MVESDVDMSHGLDFFAHGSVLARTTHLNHEPFTYKVTVINENPNVKQVTVRIFMGPVKKADNNDMPFADKKNLMIEMDRFAVTCE